jgi:hypothetical protein
MANPTADTTKPITAEMLASMPFNGSMKRLEVHGEIPGYKTQWSNDEGSRIATLIRYGFDFVKKGEIGLNDRVVDANQAVDDKVKRRVGSGDGGPIYAYLLKCPNEIWDMIQAQMQSGPDNFDRALMAGLMASRDAAAMQYTPKGVNNLDASELMQPANTPANPGGQTRRPHRMGGPSIR